MYLNYRIIIKILGAVILILGIAMIPSTVVSGMHFETDAFRAFALCSFFLIAGGGFITLKMRSYLSVLKFREGYMIVTLCWLCASLFGSAPYLLSGVTSSFADAFFESVSGFTTTGCSVFNVEMIPDSLILWKAISHLLGGMGILVFVISILPALGIGGQKIVKAEAPGPTVDKVAARISDSAKILYITYISFGIAEFILLSVSSMSTFDAVIHTLGSISTSGLSNHYNGIAYFHSFYVECVISTFTILASINFVLYANIARGKLKAFISNLELRVFLTIILAAAVLVSSDLLLTGTYTTITDAFRYGTFQVIAFATTTGQPVANFTLWPDFSKMILFILMFIGGCAASTCGAIKVIRVIIMFKLIIRGFAKLVHPRLVVAVKLRDHAVPAQTVSNITSFIFTYLAIFVFSNFILSLQNLDFITTMSTTASMLSNTGCHLGVGYGTAYDFGMYSAPLKLYLSFLMIIGRLELFTIIVLLNPKFWNYKS